MSAPSADLRIDTRSGRRALTPAREPAWRKLATGCYLGYRRHQDGGSWIARWRGPDGRQHYQALGRADDSLPADGVAVLSFDHAQASARTWFQAAEARARLGRPSARYRVADCLADYLGWAEGRRKSAATMRVAARAHILPALGEIDTADLTPAVLRRWHEELAARPPRHRREADGAEAQRRRRLRANRHLTLLKAALNRAWRDGLITSRDAWMRVEPFPGVEANRVNFLTPDQARALIAACPPDLGLLVQLALVTGARYGELARFQVRDFHPASATLWVAEAKSGRPRRLILTEEAAALCTRLSSGRPPEAPLLTKADGSPWGRDHHIRRFRAAATAAGLIDGFTFHELRHTWASLAIMAGMALALVAQMLGHADTRMAERHYGHLAPDYMAAAVRASAPRFGLAA